MEQLSITQMNPTEFKSLFKGLENSIKSYIDNRLTSTNPDRLLTREETADYLKIDLSTLWKWSKTGKLPSYGINGRVYYRSSDIEEALIPLNSSYGNKKASKSSTAVNSISKNCQQ
jgi:predicted DNA-binding transcriptional regulator AlpA